MHTFIVIIRCYFWTAAVFLSEPSLVSLTLIKILTNSSPGIHAAARPNLARCRLSPCYIPYLSLFPRTLSGFSNMHISQIFPQKFGTSVTFWQKVAVFNCFLVILQPKN